MSAIDDKNETSRFLGEGVSFKAKLIGILEVSEARGDRMCQEALSDLKTAIRAAGEHKQRITINIAIDGLRLRDEKTGDSLYHHPVHKISFIAQDMTDSRAFGYIFGSPDTGHRFFGIKTDKAASQVVIAMRDLFQVVFALKKKEVELAKQHLDKSRYGSSPLFSETNLSSSKLSASTTESSKISGSDNKANAGSTERSTPAVADLVDLELELNSLQQGLHQMERITPSDPFASKDDPFGDSFTPFPKPILPPPPSSGKERSSRTSESCSLFSPKTPLTGGSVDISGIDSSLIYTSKDINLSHDFNLSHDEPSSGDWFTPPASNNFFEEQPLAPEQTKANNQDQHEKKKQEILSHFDVFTDLDPLGTGKIKPYVDKKHFFQELKNPPKKVLKDLVVESQREAAGKDPTSAVFPATFDLTTSLSTTTTTTTTFITNVMNNNSNMSNNSISNIILSNVNASSKANSISTSPNLFPVDPFGEDPFVKSDPFAETDFAKQDPFDSELGVFNKEQNKTTDYIEQFKISTKGLSRSPKGTSLLEKQMSLASATSRSSAAGFTKQNTFDVHFDQMEDKKFGKLSQLHENPSLDLSSESECAPEPPPRPTTNVTQAKPPPLPPKKQPGELCVKPPPRPPHSDFDSRYDDIDAYDMAPNSLEFVGSGVEKSPPLPAPARKTKFENDFSRPRNKGTNADEGDYLTPISLPKSNQGPILLPPPQKSNRKSNISPNNLAQVTVSSYLEGKPNIVTSTPTGGEKNILTDGLDITLSQLTLSGLNELATKLGIPATQLSNMTLAQLTTYLSNFIKNKSNDSTTATSIDSEVAKNQTNRNIASFPADFANFNNFNVKAGDAYDRYAVFRELVEEEIKHSRFGGEDDGETKPENDDVKNNIIENSKDKIIDKNGTNTTPAVDRYAALREIVEIETNGRGKSIDEENNLDENTGNGEGNGLSEKQLHEKTVEVENEANIINTEKFCENKDNNKLIEYNVSLDMKSDIIVTTPLKSPGEKIVKSPIPEVITEIINNSTIRPASGSLSDAISGSSPEIDNTGSNSEVTKKTNDATGESWAMFDQLNSTQESSKEKQNVQSEEGVSPWSSDSKEFGNGSPPDWEPRIDSGSGGDRRWNRRKRGDSDGGGWWDTSAEPEVQYHINSANRRSTDSYDDDYYECYDRPRRRRQASGWTASSGQVPASGTGGHSSSSRDVSPWEEEPTSRRREYREGRQTWTSKHAGSGRQHSFERHKDKRYNDSWDEEDDYEYEEEHCNRYHWHGNERHDVSMEHHRWTDEWNEDSRKHPTRRRRDIDNRERWCCPDWNQIDMDKPSGGRYSGRWSDIPPSSKRRDRERYYSRDSQESPWEDEYSNDPEESGGGGGGVGGVVLTPHYSTTRRTWKRPSSASEMDRKTGEIKSRQGPHHLGTGGSDGERDRRYRSGRRSKSRETPFPEVSHSRHKPDPGLTLRTRPKHHHQKASHFESDYSPDMPPKKSGDGGKVLNLQDHSGKKSSAIGCRKKTKESPKTEESNRKDVATAARQSQSLFENDFVSEIESPCSAAAVAKRFTFENDFETSEADSPIIKSRSVKSSYTRDISGSKFLSSRSSHLKQRSLFEDDFSPTEKSDTQDSPVALNVKEEDHQRPIDSLREEEQDSFGGLRSSGNGLRKKILNKNRISTSTDGIKKSESVNIFARENDPFDDEFFSGRDIGEATSVEICINGGNGNKISPRTTELKWTEQFEDFDTLDDK
ncbi:Dab [Trypoxylus dichotomus]